MDRDSDAVRADRRHGAATSIGHVVKAGVGAMGEVARHVRRAVPMVRRRQLMRPRVAPAKAPTIRFSRSCNEFECVR